MQAPAAGRPAHVSPGLLHWPLGSPSQVYATVLQSGGPGGATWGLVIVGVHALSVSVSGAMESAAACAEVTPKAAHA